MNTEGTSWDQRKLNLLFSEGEIEEIEKIPIDVSKQDSLI